MTIKSQQGATLIMVMIVLILISIIATIAMKDSLFGTRLSTNNQVDSLLLENNNSALFNLEDPNPQKVSSRLRSNGVYGYFEPLTNMEDTLVFCYTSNRNEFFHLSRASILNSTKLGPNGYCTTNTFSGGRSVVISQIYVSRVNTDTNIPLEGMTQGVSVGQGAKGVAKMRIAATAISILPGFANAQLATIVSCLNGNPGGRGTTIQNATQCLENASVPYNVQNAEYVVGTEFNNLNR